MDIPDEIRRTFIPFLKPNPECADELRALKTQYGTILPKHYWIDFQLVTSYPFYGL